MKRKLIGYNLCEYCGFDRPMIEMVFIFKQPQKHWYDFLIKKKEEEYDTAICIDCIRNYAKRFVGYEVKPIIAWVY